MGELARVVPPKLTTKQWNHIFGTENEIYIYTKEYLYSIIVFFLSFYFSVITTRKSVIFEQLSK